MSNKPFPFRTESVITVLVIPMPIYQKEAFDVSQDFSETWKDFISMKPESVGKAEWIRQAITFFVEKQKSKIKQRKE